MVKDFGFSSDTKNVEISSSYFEDRLCHFLPGLSDIQFETWWSWIIFDDSQLWDLRFPLAANFNFWRWLYSCDFFFTVTSKSSKFLGLWYYVVCTCDILLINHINTFAFPINRYEKRHVKPWNASWPLLVLSSSPVHWRGTQRRSLKKCFRAHTG